MARNAPMVSIGLPVYNGDNYLAQAIQSIINQTFRDFELILSDNASTDETAAICLHWAKKDSRIRYIQNEQNLGAIPNFNQLVEMAKGKYFKWAAHDDVLAPTYLAKCVEILETNPTVVLCCTKVQIIDEFNKKQIPYKHEPKKLIANKPSHRFRELIKNDLDCYEIFGVIRKEVLAQTPLFGAYVAADRILRAELGLYGSFYEVKERLFFSRDHAERSIRAMPAHHQRAAWFDKTKANKRILPHWTILMEYFRCVNRSKVTFQQKIACKQAIFSWIFQNKNWAWLLLDIVLYFYPNAWNFFFKWRKDSWWKEVKIQQVN